MVISVSQWLVFVNSLSDEVKVMDSEARKIDADIANLMATTAKLNAETAKIAKETNLYPKIVAVSAAIALVFSCLFGLLLKVI